MYNWDRMINETQKNLLEIHIAVLLFGAAGLFGKFISWPAILIVAGRVTWAAAALGFFLLGARGSFRLDGKKDILMFFLLGILLAGHWTAFFKSIQISTVAIGLLTFSTFPVFVTFLEPFFTGERLRKGNIVIAFIVFFGVALVVPSIRFSDPVFVGAVWGVASGASFALLSILNRKLVGKYSGAVIAFYQDLSAAVVLLPCWYFIAAPPRLSVHLKVLLLGVVFTALAHTLFIRGMKRISAQSAGIIACLEPLYGIILAFIFLGEVPALRTLLGGLIILGAVFYVSVDAALKKTAED